jgi:hypothetical protein
MVSCASRGAEARDWRFEDREPRERAVPLKEERAQSDTGEERVWGRDWGRVVEDDIFTVSGEEEGVDIVQKVEELEEEEVVRVVEETEEEEVRESTWGVFGEGVEDLEIAAMVVVGDRVAVEVGEGPPRRFSSAAIERIEGS